MGHLAGMGEAFEGGIRHVAMRVQRSAAARRRSRLVLARRRGGDAGPCLLDPELGLPYPTQPIGLRLGIRLAAGLHEIDEPTRLRGVFAFGSAEIELQLKTARIVGGRVLNVAIAMPEWTAVPGAPAAALTIPSIGARIETTRAFITASRLTRTTIC